MDGWSDGRMARWPVLHRNDEFDNTIPGGRSDGNWKTFFSPSKGLCLFYVCLFCFFGPTFPQLPSRRIYYSEAVVAMRLKPLMTFSCFHALAQLGELKIGEKINLFFRFFIYVCLHIFFCIRFKSNPTVAVILQNCGKILIE